MKFDKKKFLKLFPLPWTYDKYGGCIMDAEPRKVIDIRGWGKLTTSPKIVKSIEEARDIQDAFGEWLTEKLNELMKEEDGDKSNDTDSWPERTRDWVSFEVEPR